MEHTDDRTEEHDDGPATWADAVADFERRLLEQLFARYPSTRKLAARLSTSHTMIATKLRKYGIGRHRGGGSCDNENASS